MVSREFIDNFPGRFTFSEPDPEETFPMQLAWRRLGFTQRELAHRLGVDESTVWHWEKGLHRPIPRHQERLDIVLASSASRTP